MTDDCTSLRTFLLEMFANELEVSLFERGCVVTMPLKTIDDRFIDVWIERVEGSGFVYVHDGGKNTAELYAQGIHATDGQEDLFKGLARRYGVFYQEGRFQLPCSAADRGRISAAVLAVSQCATAAMIDVVTHEAKIEDEPLSGRVGRALTEWQPDYIEIRRRHQVVGKTGVLHLFDFVSMPIARRDVRTVCIRLLPPSVGPTWQVSRYGFTALDIEGTAAADWSRLAIISKVEEWPTKAIETIQAMSEATILLKSGDEARVEIALPDMMTRLSAVA